MPHTVRSHEKVPVRALVLAIVACMVAVASPLAADAASPAALWLPDPVAIDLAEGAASSILIGGQSVAVLALVTLSAVALVPILSKGTGRRWQIVAATLDSIAVTVWLVSLAIRFA